MKKEDFKLLTGIILIAIVLILSLAFMVNAQTIPLKWKATTLNEDGSVCTDLAGYNLYHGDKLTEKIDVGNVTQYDFPMTGCVQSFGLKAYNTSGNESTEMSEVKVKWNLKIEWIE